MSPSIWHLCENREAKVNLHTKWSSSKDMLLHRESTWTAQCMIGEEVWTVKSDANKYEYGRPHRISNYNLNMRTQNLFELEILEFILFERLAT